MTNTQHSRQRFGALLAKLDELHDEALTLLDDVKLDNLDMSRDDPEAADARQLEEQVRAIFQKLS